ncbi:MAG: CRISPR-associated helicase Cas3' [Anaerovoracaceae bacterium]
MELLEVLNLDGTIYAHCPNSKEGKRETLEAHSELSLSYFNRLVKAKKLEPIFDNIISTYLGKDDKNIKKICFDLLKYAVLFHDTGKINPEFQRNKMRNNVDKREGYLGVSGSNHALLSSVIYLNFALEMLNEGDYSKAEKKKLKGITYINSYVISRHHSNIADLQSYGGEFIEGGGIYNIVEGQPKDKYYNGLSYLSLDNINRCGKFLNIAMKDSTRQQEIGIYVYTRLIYSLLVAADYYATTEYIQEMEITNFGELEQVEELKQAFEQAELTEKIRSYEKKYYNKGQYASNSNDINCLRSELFLDAEKTYFNNTDSSLFFLEAPTGSGKSNTAMNLSFKMLNKHIRKIFYVYPFNTLVEQNLTSIKKVFGKNEDILSKLTIVNSITPIKQTTNRTEEEDSHKYYQECLLDRQFLNYPLVLTTHVSLFNTMFGVGRQDVFGFMQLANSVIVLDEIQSYKNTIWSEIIIFLKTFGELLNIKVIIMSATLPNLEYLTGEAKRVVHLISNREKYFSNRLFKERVKVSYELLKEEMDLDKLYDHMLRNLEPTKKVLVEFIRKKSAYEFFNLLQEKVDMKSKVFLMTGDDNQEERKHIIREVTEASEVGIVLVATQVIEAGVDIDMDIGYKDISKLDSEEQFLGRINRSCKGDGITYFFNMDSADKIYKNDIRISREFTLGSEIMKTILKEKNFGEYYKPILDQLKKSWNQSTAEDSLEEFFSQDVMKLNFQKVSKRMALIDESDWEVSLFLSRDITLENGDKLIGKECWEEYKELLQNEKIDYAQKQVELSHIRSNMNYFIYQVNRNIIHVWNDEIGELYYLEDGEEYFTNGKLDTKLIDEKGGMFITL